MVKIYIKNLYLTLIQKHNTDAVYQLRSQYGQYLNNTGFSSESNASYIAKYQLYIEECVQKALPCTDFYFSINYKERVVGTIRVYNIDYTQRIFTWGSWILDRTIRGGGASLSTALGIYGFAYDYLKLRHAFFDVRKDNIKTISFHKKIGAQEEGEDAENVYFSYTHNEYKKIRNKYTRYIEPFFIEK